MKVSNNALNFLLAQYRAIFKRAYIKGLAPAVMLTAALAAGQAQAVTTIDDTNHDQYLSGTAEVKIDGSATKITISGTASTGTIIDWSNPNVSIVSGSTTDNYIKGSGGAVTITGSGSLTINTEQAAQGLGVTGHDNGVNISLGLIDIKKGTLSIDASGSNASVTANTINIGDSGSTSKTRDATLQLTGTTVSQTATLGGDGAVINVFANGQLKATTDSGAIFIKGDALNLGAGALFISDAGATSGATITIESKKLDAAADSVHVIYDDSKAFTEEFKGQSATIAGNLLVGQSGTLVLEPKTTAEGEVEGLGTVTLAKGSNTVITGALKVNAGTLVVESGAALNATAATAKITVVGDDDAHATLRIDSDTLKGYIAGGSKYVQIGNDGTLGTSADQTGVNALFELSGGRLEFKNTESIDLATDFKLSGTATAGMITVNTSKGGTIYGQNLTVSKTLNNGAQGELNGSTSNLKLEAEKLTLGSSTLVQADEKDLGFASAQARHLTVVAADGTFTLANTVNLAATRSVEQNGQTIIEADSGTITGNMVVSGILSVQGGSYEAADALDISGGTLSVVNKAVEGKNVDTRLDVKGNLKLVATTGSEISVDGNNAKASTILDISDATLSFDSGAKTANVKAVNGGTLILKGDQLENLLLTATGSNSGSTVQVSGGTIQVVDDLTLDASKIVIAAADQKLAFTGTNGAGELIVEDELTLNNVTDLSLGGASGSIRAGILNLNGASDDAAASLKSGSYTALRSLTTDGKQGITVGDTATLALGAIDSETLDDGTIEHIAQGGGSITADVVVNNSNGAFNVVAGDWNGAKRVTITSGNMQVGALNGSSAYLDADGEEITASLSVSSLKIDADGTATVNSTGSLSTSRFSASGDLVVNGEATISGVANTDTIKDNGISVGANSIEVGAGGKLSLTDYAIDALGNTTADSAGKYFTTASTSYTAEGIKVQAGGEVYLDFAEGTELNVDALKALRSALFVTEADGTIAGSINIGAGSITGIEADTDGKFDWDDLSQYGDVLSNFTFDELKAGVVKNVDNNSQVRGQFGAIESSTIPSGGKVTIVGNSSLNNAAANGGKFAAGMNGALLGLNVTNGSRMELNNGGSIGTVSLDQGSTLAVNTAAGVTSPSTTYIGAIDGAQGTAEFGVGAIEVQGATTVGNLTTKETGAVTFTGKVTVGSSSNNGLETNLLGSNTFKQAAAFHHDTEIGGTATFEDGVSFGNYASIYGNTAVTGGAEFADSAEIGDGATLTADVVELSGSGLFFSVGEDDYVENGQTKPGSTGYLQAASVILNGNTLVVDPSYEHETSVAAIEGFDDKTNTREDAGTFSGDIFVGQNAALGVGPDMTIAQVQDFIRQYQNNHGALIQDQVGSVMYLNGMLTATDGSRIILDSQHTTAQVFEGANALMGDGKTYHGTYNNAPYKADLYLGQNTILAVSDAILADGAAISFESKDAAIMAQKVADNDDAAKIVLDGTGFLDSREITLFKDAGQDPGVKVLGDQDIRVETLNGVMYFMLEAGKEVTGGKLNLDTTKIDTAYAGATDESRELLLAYTSQTANFREYFDPDNLAKDQSDKTKVEREVLHGDVASSNIATYDATATNGVKLSQAAIDSGDYDVNDFYAVPTIGEDGKPVVIDGVAQGTVYYRAYNDLLEAIARNTDGAATDSAALQGVFGGAAQAALLAARTSQDAVAGRTGVGASSSALSFADNGQGAGLWLAPIYVSSDSDGFELGNKDYGVDIDLYGVALGGDYTLANGLRLGAFFNVGSGDVDGNGQAAGVSNDFNYYGVGLYAGYSVGQFSLVGDLSYTVVDSDVEASTAVGKMSSSFDTDNISVGVTGQYEFAFGQTLVTPHLGLRYSALSVDDYQFKADGFTQGGNASIDDANVFSIPVGVTIAQEFAFDSWTVKPSLDVTVQGNFGDDELDSSAVWDNVAWQSNYKSEFIDSFTYGATLGIAAQTGAFSAGFGLGYQGSSNTDELSVNANARFTF